MRKFFNLIVVRKDGARVDQFPDIGAAEAAFNETRAEGAIAAFLYESSDGTIDDRRYVERPVRVTLLDHFYETPQ